MSAYSIFLFGFRFVGIIKTSRLFFLRYPVPKLPVHSGHPPSLLHRFWVDDRQISQLQKETKALSEKDFIHFSVKAIFGLAPVKKQV